MLVHVYVFHLTSVAGHLHKVSIYVLFLEFVVDRSQFLRGIKQLVGDFGIGLFGFVQLTLKLKPIAINFDYFLGPDPINIVKVLIVGAFYSPVEFL